MTRETHAGVARWLKQLEGDPEGSIYVVAPQSVDVRTDVVAYHKLPGGTFQAFAYPFEAAGGLYTARAVAERCVQSRADTTVIVGGHHAPLRAILRMFRENMDKVFAEFPPQSGAVQA